MKTNNTPKQGPLSRVLFTLLLGATAAVTVRPVSAAATYQVTALGTLAGSTGTLPRSVNDSGQVTGTVYYPNGSENAFLYSGGVIRDLGTLGRSNGSEGFGINASGLVTGYSPAPPADPIRGYQAFLYNGGMVGLNDLGGDSFGYAINDSGEITGRAQYGNEPCQAFLYSGGTTQSLGTLPGFTASRGTAINASAQIVGNANNSVGEYSGAPSRAFLYSGGVMTNLGTLGGTNSYASGINTSTQVTGSADLPNGSTHAFLYSNGTMTDLGTLGGTYSGASGINDSGQVVGTAALKGESGSAFIYDGGVMTDLNALISPFYGHLSSANAISNNGTIVGEGTLGAYLLTPVAAIAWTGANNTIWAETGNWSGSVPGATTGTTNADTATFNQNVPKSPLTIDAGRNLQNITFDTANVNSLTIGTVGGPALILTADGWIHTTSTVVNAQTINAPLILAGDSAFTSGASTSLATLKFGGRIAPAATSGLTTLLLTGSNTGANSINGPLTDNGSGKLAVTMSGTGVWGINGANTYSGNTTVSSGTLRLAGGSVNNVPSSPMISVGNGATLDVTGLASSTLVLGSGNVAQFLAGRGAVTGSVTVDGGLANGSGNAAVGSAITGGSGGTLTIMGGLTVQNGSVSNFALGAPNGSGNPLTAFVNVTGAAGLAVNGTHTVNLSGAARVGTYELYAFTTGTPLATQFSIGTKAAGNFIYGFNVIPNAEVDLIVASSVAWDFNGGGNYSDSSKWTPGLVPSGAGAPAILGNGVSNTVNTMPSITVLVDGADVVGSLVFSNTKGTGYILGNDGVAGHGITLNNNGKGAAITVSASALQTIAANMTLADNVAFNINSGSSLSITGNLNESGGSRSLTFTGPGTLTLGSANSFSGGTTLNTGTLNAAASGALGTGPVTINSGTLNATAAGALYSSSKVTINAVGINSTLNLSGSQTVSNLTTNGTGTAAAVVAVPSGSTLLSTGALTTTGKFNVPGFGRTEIDGAPTLNSNSAITVTNGTLRFNVASGAATIGTAVTATAGLRGTLELAGSVSALSFGANRVNINTFVSGHGILVSGTHQQVGNVDGAGNTQVNAGSDLTANHIIQGALIIGGTMGNPGQVTIAASDAAGNPLGQSLPQPNGLILAGSLASSGSLGNGVSSCSLIDGLAGSGSDFPAPSPSSDARDPGSSAVPEPSTMMMIALALAGLFVNALRVRCPAAT